MSVYRDGKFYYYDFIYKGKRYKASTEQTSKTVARDVEAAERRKLREGRTAVRDIKFEDLAKEYLKVHAAGKRGESFYKFTVRVLSREFDGRMLSEIGPAEVDAFMARRRLEVKPSTANRSLTILKHMFRLAVRWRNMDTNPAADVRADREPRGRERFLTAQEASKLIQGTPAWLRPVVVVALHTGARQGELLGLTWADVDLDRGLLSFRYTKNGEPRTVKLSATARLVLGATAREARIGRVFRNKSGAAIHRDGLTWSFRRAVRLAGLEGFRFHDLRHSAASFMVQAGVPLNTVREILGHRSLGMTLRYAHLAPDHQAQAVAVMDTQVPAGGSA